MNYYQTTKPKVVTQLSKLFFALLPALCLVLYRPGLAIAEITSHQSHDYSALESRLLEHPRLRRLKYQSTAMKEFATATSALPDPTISLGLNNVPIDNFSFDRFLPTNKSIGIQQNIPNRGIRKAREENAKTKSKSLDLTFAYEHSQLRASLIIALIEQVKLERKISLAQQRDRKYSELQQVIRNEINAGRAVVFRLARIDIERAEVAQEIFNFRSQLAGTRAEIIRLVDSPANTPPPPLSIIQWDGDHHTFHRVKLALADIAIAETRADEVRAEHGPSWGMSLMYQQRDAGAGESTSNFNGTDWFTGQVSFTVPIWAGKKQAPALRAAIAERAAEEMDVLSIARNVESDWRSIIADRQAAESNITLLKEQLGILDEQIAASLTTYESGSGDYAPIIDAEITRLRFQSQISREVARRDIMTVKANSQLVTL